MPYFDALLGHRLGPQRVNDEVGDQVAQIDSVVEPLGEGGEIGLGLFAVLQRFEGARHHGLEVAQHGVDPLEFAQVAWFGDAHHFGHVDAAGFGDGSKAPQAVALYDRLGLQTGLGPLGYRLRLEAADDVELDVQRLDGSVHRDCCDDGNLVFRASTGLAASSLATQVGIIQLHGATKEARGLLPRHGVVDLVVQQPGGGVAHAQVPFEGKRRDARVCLADEVEGQKRGRQRQLGMFHQGASGQRGLVPALAALVQLAAAVIHKIVMSAIALRATKLLRPPRALERLGALRFGAKTP